MCWRSTIARMTPSAPWCAQAPRGVPKRPVVCVDETFKQLIGETRAALPPRPGSVERVDHVYTRNGVASLFLACEPLAGWRHIEVTAHRRRTDWAGFIRSLLEGRYRDAEKLVLIMDQLNTHSPASVWMREVLGSCDHPEGFGQDGRVVGRLVAWIDELGRSCKAFVDDPLR